MRVYARRKTGGQRKRAGYPWIPETSHKASYSTRKTFGSQRRTRTAWPNYRHTVLSGEKRNERNALELHGLKTVPEPMNHNEPDLNGIQRLPMR